MAAGEPFAGSRVEGRIERPLPTQSGCPKGAYSAAEPERRGAGRKAEGTLPQPVNTSVQRYWRAGRGHPLIRFIASL